MCVCVCLYIFIFFIILYVNCFGRTMLYMCIEYHIQVNMYHVSTQGVDECMINVHYYYYKIKVLCFEYKAVTRPPRVSPTNRLP